MIKRSIQEEDIIIVNIYAPNIGASQYIKQTWKNIKGEIDGNIIIVRDFNTPLTMNRSMRSLLHGVSFETRVSLFSVLMICSL